MSRAVVVMMLCVAVLAALAARAQAQPAPAGSAEDRYAFSEVDEGYLRMDKRSGQVSLCRPRSNGWSCQTVPDDRAALENQISRLQAEIATLKQATVDRAAKPAAPPKSEPLAATGADQAPVARKDDQGPVTKGSEQPPAAPSSNRYADALAKDQEIKMPSSAEVDRTMPVFERVWRRLIEMMVNLQKELREKT